MLLSTKTVFNVENTVEYFKATRHRFPVWKVEVNGRIIIFSLKVLKSLMIFALKMPMALLNSEHFNESSNNIKLTWTSLIIFCIKRNPQKKFHPTYPRVFDFDNGGDIKVLQGTPPESFLHL